MRRRRPWKFLTLGAPNKNGHQPILYRFPGQARAQIVGYVVNESVRITKDYLTSASCVVGRACETYNETVSDEVKDQINASTK